MSFRLSLSLMCIGLAVAAPAMAADRDPKPTIDKRAPDYVRCKSLAETGSLITKKNICRTNAEWTKANEAGNAEARDIVARSLVRGAAPQ